ncbi:MAG: DUF805 domain-containing protein [Erythrobacter sp.]|uniref:DUF805 domain-containing protein n=1 Tax=Erythrobacter sp. TaxID=1042 RepID=UPI0025D9A1F2|nr:DUF805 domain-containing protein [Erythrobacter sp.]MCL9999007.1 DUF805 domain-containing protein [Erythrobacter sp.]
MFASLIQPIRRTFDFRGRARRTEYWAFILWQLGFLAGGLNLVSLLPESQLRENLVLAVFGLYLLAFGLPTLALQMRRVHDHGASGGMLMVIFIPYLGVGWFFWLMMAAGTLGPNRYGEDPRAVGVDAALFD